MADRLCTVKALFHMMVFTGSALESAGESIDSVPEMANSSDKASKDKPCLANSLKYLANDSYQIWLKVFGQSSQLTGFS